MRILLAILATTFLSGLAQAQESVPVSCAVLYSSDETTEDLALLTEVQGELTESGEGSALMQGLIAEGDYSLWLYVDRVEGMVRMSIVSMVGVDYTTAEMVAGTTVGADNYLFYSPLGSKQALAVFCQ